MGVWRMRMSQYVFYKCKKGPMLACVMILTHPCQVSREAGLTTPGGGDKGGIPLKQPHEVALTDRITKPDWADLRAYS